jgi:hypothetical protein
MIRHWVNLPAHMAAGFTQWRIMPLTAPQARP